MDWLDAPSESLEFEVPIIPGNQSRYTKVDSLSALAVNSGSGFDELRLYAQRDCDTPLLSVRLGEWSPWILHDFQADGQTVRAGLRAKLLRLSPDGQEVHLYLSEIYPVHDFVHPTSLASELLESCGPFIIQCSRQQVVQGGASDIATYFDEQKYLARWWQNAANHVLSNHEWDLFMLKWHGPDWTNHLTMYMIDPRHPMYEEERAEEGWALWDELMRWGDDIVASVMEAAGPDTLVALVSDHGGDTMLPGFGGHRDSNDVLAAHGWLVRRAGGGIDWTQTQAYATQHYVYLSVDGRDPQGIVREGKPFTELREEIIEALLSARDANGRHRYRAVLPMETAGRFGSGGDRVGDIFLLPAERHPLAEVSRDEFWQTTSREQAGTWDWPLLNAGSHSDDSYFVLSGPGVKQGYRRERPTLITSVAPTLAAAWGIPVPSDADGSILWDFIA